MFQWCSLGENFINTLLGSCFVDKMSGLLTFFITQAINVKWLFVHMSGNKKSIWTWLGHVRQLGHVYCLH